MRLFLIASIYKDRRGGSLGYRILDIDSGQIMDTSTSSIIYAIKNGKAIIENAEVKGNKLIGTNGSLDRYTKCTPDNRLVDEDLNTLVIINRLGTQGFTVCDYKGVIKKLKEEDAIKCANANGIANGKLVNVDGKVFISAISGSYEVIPMPESNIQNKDSKNEEVIDNSDKKLDKPSDNDSDYDILTEEQKIAISKYYKYYYKRAEIQSGSNEKAKETSRTETSEIKHILKSDNLDKSYISYQVWLQAIAMMGIDELKKLTSNELADSIETFLKLGLPMPKSMINILDWYFYRNRLGFIGSIFNNLSETMNLLKIENADIPFKEKIIDRDKAELTLEYFNAMIQYMLALDTLRIINGRFIKELDKLSIDRTRIYKYWFSIDTRSVLNRNIIQGCLVLNTQIYDRDQTQYRIKSDNEDSLLSEINSVRKNGATKTIESFINTYVDSYNEWLNDRAEDAKCIDTGNLLSKLYNEAYIDKIKEENTEQNDSEQSTSESNQVLQDKDNNETNSNELYSKPNNFDSLEWLKWLFEHNTVDDNDISVTIAKDIINRQIKEKYLSSKQKYRIDLATKLAEEANNKRLGVQVNPNNTNKKPNSKSNSKSKISDEENIKYQLSDRNDIKNKIDKLIEKANDVEMSVVLDKEPNVIKICYSVLRSKQVSTRQLIHIESAYEMLMNQ